MTMTSGNLDKKRAQSAVAMTILLVSWAMLFATLFLVYAVLRANSDSWPPMGMEKAPLFYPSLSTIFILLSSLSYWAFQKRAVKGKAGGKKSIYLTTLLLGLGFLASQLLLWDDLKARGFFVQSGIFSSLIYSFTWIHAAHVVLGLVGLLWLIPCAFGSRQSVLGVESVGKFWHFLGIIWLIMYFALFVF